MSKARFTPTVLLHVIDKSKTDQEGNQLVVKTVQCEDEVDADRIKRIFFRLLNWKLKNNHYGYVTEPLVDKDTKKQRKKKVNAQEKMSVEEYDRMLEQLRAEREEFIKREKIKQEREKKKLEIEEAKKKIMEEAKKKIEEMEKQIIGVE